MEKNILQVYNEGCPDLKFDRAFLTKLKSYVVGFANKNEDHIAFFGGTLMGVQVVRFRPNEDYNRWFDEVLEADDLAIEEELHKLEAIVPTRHVSSDVMNLSCLWVVHRIFTSPHLSASEKESGMIDALLMLQYKFITSILAHWFTYPADEAVAIATYARLSKKFGLKVKGSWGALLLSRAHDILAKGGIHYRTYTKFDNDKAIVYMVNDIQGRIKSILNHIRDEFEQVLKDPKGLIRSTTSTVSLDGEVHVKAMQRNFTQYRRYIHETVNDRRTFVLDELVNIIASAMPTMPPSGLEETLNYISLNSGPRGDKDVDRLIDDTLTHAFDYISTNADTMGNVRDIGGLLARMRALYTASRASDSTMLTMRETAERITKRSIKSKNASVIAAVRTGCILYILLRTFTMHFYRK